MSFDWKEYLIVATELLEGSDERHYRSSVGRAYYAVFCTARDKAGLTSERFGVHQKVIDHYKNSTDQTEQRIGLNLASLKRYRIKSDYEASHTIDQALANRAIIIAENILQQL